MRALLLIGILALAGPALVAETLQAEIPFTFEFANAVLPAGAYDVESVEGRIIIVSSQEHKLKTFGLLLCADSHERGSIKLVFRKYGDRHFLAKMSTLNGTTEVAKSKAERELVYSRFYTKNAPRVQEVVVLAKVR